MEKFDVEKRIRQLNEERGLSFYKLAQEAHMPTSTLTNMVARKSELSVKNIEKICRVYHMSLHEFFMNEDEEVSDRDKLLDFYDALEGEQKKALMLLIEGLLDR